MFFVASCLLLSSPVFFPSVQLSFGYLQAWRLDNLSGQPVPVFDHLHSIKVGFSVQMDFHFLQFMTVASCPVTENH